MRIDRLFHVLVVMTGAPALPACGSEDDETYEPREGSDVDAGSGNGSGGGSGSGNSECAPCFCDVESCCDRSASEPEVADGFECCWSTTCP